MLLQLSVLIENQKGNLAKVTGLLKDNNINLRAIAAFDTPQIGILRLIVDKPDLAKQVLSDNGYSAKIVKVIGLEIQDKIGALDEVLTILDENDVELDYIYSFVLQTNGLPIMVMSVSDLEQTSKLLIDKGFKLTE